MHVAVECIHHYNSTSLVTMVAEGHARPMISVAIKSR